MKMKQKKRSFLVLLTLCALSLALCVGAVPVSPALDVLALDYKMIKVGLTSRDVYFDESDFLKATGLSAIDGICIESLPEPSLGTLMLGSLALREGQTVSKKNLSNIRFVPGESGELEASFGFSTGKGGAVYSCSVCLLSRANSSPVSADPDDPALEVSTLRGIEVFGSMKASDPDNDPISYSIVKYPTHGTLEVTDTVRGNYCYLPENGFVGSDSFSYTASDKYGNTSDEATVVLEVASPETNIVFADMDGHFAHYSAIVAASRGFVDFKTSSDGKFFFDPDEPMSRAAFCAALMKSARYDGFESVSGTVFADDADIPSEYKGIITAASVLGIANGIETDGKLMFYPNNQITRAEAAVMINKLYGFESSGELAVFNDFDSTPAWAVSSISALCEAGVMKGDGSGNISAYEGLNRASAATLLVNASARKK